MTIIYIHFSMQYVYSIYHTNICTLWLTDLIIYHVMYQYLFYKNTGCTMLSISIISVLYVYQYVYVNIYVSYAYMHIE